MRENGIRIASALGLAATLAVTGACGDGPVSPRPARVQSGVTPSEAAVVARPLAERSSGQLTIVGACATGVEFVADGAGVSTHIGRFEIEVTWCLDTATGTIRDAVASVESANGDRVALSGAGQAASTTELAFHLDIVGGTGRFEGASGELDVSATVLADGGWTSNGTGWMAY